LLDVTAILARENGQKVAYVSCMLGNEVLELTTKSKGGAGGNKDLHLVSNGFGIAGVYRFQHWWRQVAG